MDQIKIGRFISERRKLANLTQTQLAEQLGITNRAVSKWETGKAMPDASIMLPLCGILDITVTDLLSGEVIVMDHYQKELENKLVEVIKEKEQADKRLLTMELVVGILSVIVLLVPILIGALVPMAEWKRVVLVFAGLVPCVVGLCFAGKIEQVAGYYACPECGHRYVPTYKAMMAAPHMGRTRKMTCPQCGKKAWQKKVLSKE